MANVPEELKYTKTHEWVLVENDNTALVGITDHAQSQLGDLVFVELPETGVEVNAGEECAVIESVKSASDVYCPLAGEITEVNDTLQDSPEAVNKDPYGDGWLFRMQLEDPSQADELMDAENYQAFLAEE